LDQITWNFDEDKQLFDHATCNFDTDKYDNNMVLCRGDLFILKALQQYSPLSKERLFMENLKAQMDE
jgi:hypothetical protein